MRTNIEVDDVLMRQAQKASGHATKKQSGHATKKQTVEEALRLMIRLRRQREVVATSLAAAQGEGPGDRCRQ